MNAAVHKRLGDFELVRELGRGGMGVVYEARQVSLNRRVALKVLAAGLGLTPHAVERFHREAEAAAKLHHTNIVPVYATGAENGTHFYDRAAARRHFRDCLKTNVFTYAPYDYAWALLPRLEKSEAWPPWVGKGDMGAKGKE